MTLAAYIMPERIAGVVGRGANAETAELNRYMDMLKNKPKTLP
jgi:hypothetical protein